MTQLDRLRAALSNRYRLEGEIGHGGMAIVYRAHDLHHGRDVAIKVVRPELTAPLGAGRFLREIHIAAGLQHPHILPLYDSGTADGILYFVMPYVVGESLRDRLLRERQLPLDDALRITQQVADALSYAHGRGVIHRDIKPGNILLSGYQPRSSSPGWHAMVADFGLARALFASEGDDLTTSGCAVGTPEYMSPEQTAGEESIDGRADIYSLGCVLYAMLAGQPPFTGRTAQALAARHRSEQPPSIRVIRPTLPAGIDDILKTALAKVPADRFPTAQDLAARVDPAQWKPPPATPVTTARSHRALIFGAIASLLVMAGAALAAKLRHGASEAALPGLGVIVFPFEHMGGGGGRGGGGDSTASSVPEHQLFGQVLNWMPNVRGIDGSDAMPRHRPVPLLDDLLHSARSAGAKYLVTGTVATEGPVSQTSVEVYSVANGERVSHDADTVTAASSEAVIGRLALRTYSSLATREGLNTAGQQAVLAATTSPAAAGHLLRAQGKFRQGDLDGAATDLHAAIQADSTCGLAYQRLGVVETWQHDYPAALAALDAGLSRRDRLSPRWVTLMEGQRYYVLGLGDSAIASFQSAVLENRSEVDGWLGLAEALVHFAGFTGHSTGDARPAFDRVAALDSSFAPIYLHLVDLAVYAGDERAARAALAQVPARDPIRIAKEVAIDLRFGSSQKRADALARLRSADREALREAVIFWIHGGFDFSLADTAARDLMSADRTPDDRRRGAQYRLIALASRTLWADALEAWRPAAEGNPFDAWIVQAYLAGYPFKDVAEPMFAWARQQVRGREPDFSLPPWNEVRQAFEALVYRATVEGDSAEVQSLLNRIKQAPPANPTEPAPRQLQASLEARLQLLAGDTAAAMSSLRRSLAQIAEIYTANHPLTAMGPQRFLLSELAARRGDSVEGGRWRDSFVNSWSIADPLYLARLGLLTPRR
jgi:eukaryotic-like serine/threonine-protein kinase